MKVFLSGVAGTGMSSLAGLMKQRGFNVLGSDKNFYPPTGTVLKEMGITLFKSFSEKNIPDDIDLCVIGNIVSRGNPEAEYILNSDIPYISMAEALYRYFIRGKKSIVAAGTHGKTTTSSFLAFMLQKGGLDPGFFIGGTPLDQTAGYRVGGGDYFISEGDEYETSFFDRSSKFLKYHPKYLILTALEYDHLDFFRSPEDYLYSFRNLVNQVPSEGVIIVNSDYPMGIEAVDNSFAEVITYGEESGDYRIENIEADEGKTTFVLSKGSDKMNFETSLRGKYNVWNLASGIILGLKLGIPMEIIERSVMGFNGVKRRFRELGRIENCIYFEDFAHHPTSIKAVLSSIKDTYRDRSLEVFIEPGSWSLKRKEFEGRFADSLKKADRVTIKSIGTGGKIPEEFRTDLKRVIEELNRSGTDAKIAEDYQDIKDDITAIDNSVKRVVILLSNGGFGGIPDFTSSLIGNYH